MEAICDGSGRKTKSTVHIRSCRHDNLVKGTSGGLPRCNDGLQNFENLPNSKSRPC